MPRGVRLGFDERRDQRLLGWVIVVLFLLGLLAFIVKGSDEPKDPYLKPAAGSAPAVALTTVPAVTVAVARTPVPGFGEVTFRVGGAC